jgi:phosphoribosylamine---glycine ligase
VIVDDDGTPWPLEFTTRGGWPALNLESAAFDCDFVEFFHQLASGKVRGKVHKLDEVYLGIVMALPDFPYSHATRKEVVGVPIYGLSPRLLRDVHFCQAMMGEAPQKKGSEVATAPIHVSAGDYVAVITGSGTTVQAAQRAAYGCIRKLSMPSGAFHRNDIGLRCKKDIPAIQAHGFASGMAFS